MGVGCSGLGKFMQGAHLLQGRTSRTKTSKDEEMLAGRNGTMALFQLHQIRT